MDPTFLPAWRLAELIRGGAISCLELLDHYIARIERLDGRTNAVVVRDFDRARERARTLDAQRRDGRATPLFGVPMTVKESFNLAGLPTTWGHEEQRHSAAHEDALAVQRLNRSGRRGVRQDQCAGGPRRLAELQSGVRRDVEPMEPRAYAGRFFGRRRGGHGGGVLRARTRQRHRRFDPRAGALLRRVRSQAELGTVLQPRPVAGTDRVDDRHLGDRPAGPFGRGPVAGAGCDRRRRSRSLDAAGVALPPPRALRLSQLRIAVWSSEAGQETDAETTAHIDALADFLEREGAQVSRAARPDFDVTEAFHLYLKLLAAALSGHASEAMLARMRAAKARRPADDMSADAVSVRAVDMTHREWLHLNERRFHIRRVWGAFFQDWDVLLCPVIATPALPHMQQGQTWERTRDGEWPLHPVQ